MLTLLSAKVQADKTWYNNYISDGHCARHIVAAPPQPAITVVLLKRQGRWCSHNETLWIRPGSYSILSGSEIRTGHFVVLQIY